MEFGSNRVLADTASPKSNKRGRRYHYRQRLSTLAYVNLDSSNGAIIRDLSPAGLALQAVKPVQVNQEVRLRFDLTRPRLHVETAARVAWADSRGQAGVEFLNLAERPRRLLKEWIFTQFVARGERLARMGSVFVPPSAGEEAGAADELLFSSTPRPSIRLAPVRNTGDNSFGIESPPTQTLRLRWFALPISPAILAQLADGLILLGAVLLFSILAVAMTGIMPAWPVALILLASVTSLFAFAYWFLFAVLRGVTPGEEFARRNSREELDEEISRFR
jgi:hypothetical protein